MPGDDHLRAHLLQPPDVPYPLLALLRGDFAGERVRLVEQDVTTIKGLYRGNPDDRIVLEVAHDFRQNFDALAFKLEPVMGHRFYTHSPGRHVGRPDDVTPVVYLPEHLLVDGARHFRQGNNLRLRKCLDDRSPPELMVGGGMGDI